MPFTQGPRSCFGVWPGRAVPRVPVSVPDEEQFPPWHRDWSKACAFWGTGFLSKWDEVKLRQSEEIVLRSSFDEMHPTIRSSRICFFQRQEFASSGLQCSSHKSASRLCFTHAGMATSDTESCLLQKMAEAARTVSHQSCADLMAFSHRQPGAPLVSLVESEPFPDASRQFPPRSERMSRNRSPWTAFLPSSYTRRLG
jgi:hypothetical protein